MVVLEPLISTDNESKPSKSTTDQPKPAGVASTGGDESDGYETASETEVNDDETESETVSDHNNNSNPNDAVQQKQHQPEEVSIVSKDQSDEITVNEEELNQVIIRIRILFGF